MKTFVFIGVHSWFALSALANPLDDQIAAYKTAANQTEAAVSAILQSGLAEGRSAQAFTAVKPWLDAQPSPSPAVLWQAGQSAERAGEWPAAVSFYRKLLKHPGVDAQVAAAAAPAAYRLLINHLGDIDAAYLLMREDGDRLRTFGRARQFDAWFITQAKTRGDLPALCGRLAAILRADAAQAGPLAGDLEWTCAQLESFSINDEAALEAARKLATTPNLPAAFKARLEWVAEIVPYTKAATELFRANKPVPDALADKPLQAAQALIAALPRQGSVLVARGWMNLREGHTPNLYRYTSPRRAAKTAPIIKALSGLPAEQARAVLSARGCPQGREVYALFYDEKVTATAELKTLVRSLPEVFNSLAAPAGMAMFDATLTVADARALAPMLERNPSGHAALVRAYAAAGTNTVAAVVPALMKSELWRFESAKAALDLVWNSGLKRDKLDLASLGKQFEKLGPRHDQLRQQVAKEASSQDRMAAFAAVYQELQSGNPATPGLLKLWEDLLKQAPPADGEKILRKLVADFTAAPTAAMELQKYFLEQALAKISFGNSYSRVGFGPELVGGWDQWGNENVRKALPGLAGDLGAVLRKQMAAGAVSEAVFGMWLHCASPGDPAAKALFQELVKSPAYGGMNPAYHQMAAHKLLFGRTALTTASLTTDAEYISRELLALPKDAPPAAVEAALKTVVDRVAAAPTVVVVVGLQPLAGLPKWSDPTRALLFSLFRENAPIGPYPAGQGYESLVARIAMEAQENKQWGPLEPLAGGLWHAAATKEDSKSPGAVALSFLAEAALKNDAPSIAATFARTALRGSASREVFPRQDWGIPAIATRIRGISGKAAAALGAAEIPVDETDPAYPIYKSHAEFVQGNTDSAWNLYAAHSEQLPPVLRKLTIEYAFWLLQRNVEADRGAPAEALVRELTIWSSAAPGTFSPEQEARLKIAYADLAFRNGALPTARAWYRKVAYSA